MAELKASNALDACVVTSEHSEMSCKRSCSITSAIPAFNNGYYCYNGM